MAEPRPEPLRERVSKNETYISCWIPAKKGIAIVKTGYIRSIMLIRWVFAFAIPEPGKRQLKL